MPDVSTPARGWLVALALAAAAPATAQQSGFTSLYVLTGENPGDEFGFVMEDVGDLDGDGRHDLAVTAPGYPRATHAGRVYVFSGASGAPLFVLDGQPGERFGHTVDAAGDVDGDGVGDIVVGAPNLGPGHAYVFSGRGGALLLSLAGQAPGDRFGSAAATAGDNDGDGHADLIVGASAASGAVAAGGRAYLVSGLDGHVVVSVEGQLPAGQFGTAAAGGFDLDGDGIPDFAVGSQAAAGGRIEAFSGATGQRLFLIPADTTGAALGQFWLESPGDVNLDGVPDLFAVDISNAAAGPNTGRAYVFSGTDGAPLLVVTGQLAGDQFGIGRGIGDADGDGVPDLALAAWLGSGGALQGGKLSVHSGRDGSVLWSANGTLRGERLGYDLVGLGDVDGDGLVDLAASGGITATTTGRVYVIRGGPYAPAASGS